MITAVIFLVLLSGVVLGGVVIPTVSMLKNTRNVFGGARSYLLAESGTEDVLYRLKNNLQVDNSESLTLNGDTVDTIITDLNDSKEVTSTAQHADYIKKVKTAVVAGTGANFNYGIQTGNGGFEMANNAQVDGNVYSNGNILGGTVTGSAIAANSIPTVTDQTNDSPANPPSDIIFRNDDDTEDLAQSFTVAVEAPIRQVELYIKKVGAPADAVLQIMSDGAGEPGDVLASGTLSAGAVGSVYAWIPVAFDVNPLLTAGTTYWIVVDNSRDSSSEYYVVGANDTYVGGVAKVGELGDKWDDTVPADLDAYFKIYLGGLMAVIDDVNVGSAGGEAWAHTVTDSNVLGELYCQVESGNNKACDTSRADPTPQAMPISDANIAEFKAQAELGGVFIGDYVASGTTIGPLRITGDLIFNNSDDLIISGTIWAEGNLILTSGANGKLVTLDASYEENGGVIVLDGYADLANGAIFNGTGQEGSYIMLLTTSDCDPSNACGHYAIDVPNNAGTIILNAQWGTLHFKNNSGAKEATAYKIVMDNEATVIYESGLTNINFTSGPSGGWQINSWREVE